MRTTIADIYGAELERAEREGRVEHVEGLKIVRDQNDAAAFAKVWRGKARKPFAHYRFWNVGQREQWIARQIESERQSRQFRADTDAKRKADELAMREQIQVGTLLHYSWGYEQTNCEFFQVVSKSGSYVTIRRIASRYVPGTGGNMSEKRSPVRDHFIGAPQRKRVGWHGLSMGHGAATPCGDNDQFFCSWYG